MVKTKRTAELGNTIISARHKRGNAKASTRHSSADQKVIESVTQETSLDAFLANADLAGTEFTAERITGACRIVSPDKQFVEGYFLINSPAPLFLFVAGGFRIRIVFLSM